jgi:hypothetical protein
MASTYKFTSSTNRVTMQKDNGQTLTPAVNDIGTGSIANMVYVDIRNVRVFTIDITVDFIAITTNNTTTTRGPAQSPYANGAAAEAAIVALFPNANSDMSLAQLDARFVKLSNNLSDIPNASTARTNLGIVHLFVINANNATIALSTTAYFSPGASASSTNRLQRVVIMPVAGTVKNLRVVAIGTQPSSGALTITMQKGSTSSGMADQSVTLTIAANATAEDYSDLANSFTVAAGDKVTIKCVNAATAVSIPITALSFILAE